MVPPPRSVVPLCCNRLLAVGSGEFVEDRTDSRMTWYPMELRWTCLRCNSMASPASPLFQVPDQRPPCPRGVHTGRAMLVDIRTGLRMWCCTRQNPVDQPEIDGQCGFNVLDYSVKHIRDETTDDDTEEGDVLIRLEEVGYSTRDIIEELIEIEQIARDAMHMRSELH